MKEKYSQRVLVLGVTLTTLFLGACANGGGALQQATGTPSIILQAWESANAHLEKDQCIVIFKQGSKFRLSPIDCDGAPPHQMEGKTAKLKSECSPPSPCAKYSFKAKFKGVQGGVGHPNWFEHDIVMTVKDVDGDQQPDFDSNGLPIEVKLEPGSHPDNDDHDIPGRTAGMHGGGAHYR